MNKLSIDNFICPGKRAHLVGIGGVSMSPLAEVLNSRGVIVTGSDMSASEATEHLRSLGIRVHIGHSADNLGSAEFIIRTAAAHDDNAEIAAARAAGIPVFERAEAWGSIMKNYKNAVCIAGTHGKTTTTSMATHILMAADTDPTVMIGGTLPMLGSGYRVGAGDSIVLESCEYYDSFLSFFPTVAVIVNIDADHLDYFSGIDAIKDSFCRFASLVPEDGWVVINADDVGVVDIAGKIDRRQLSFSLRSNADLTANNIRYTSCGSEFDVLLHGELYAHISLSVPGDHNITDALAACGAAVCLGIDGEAAARGLENFMGAGRRFEFKGEINGARVYDDYAHHPGEIKALLDAVAGLGYKRCIVAFQPHTYTRTKALFDEFAEQLRRPDHVLLADIYAAREQNTIGISSADLAAVIPGAEYIPGLERIEARLRELASPGDIIITVGAGNIYTVGDSLVK